MHIYIALHVLVYALHLSLRKFKFKGLITLLELCFWVLIFWAIVLRLSCCILFPCLARFYFSNWKQTNDSVRLLLSIKSKHTHMHTTTPLDLHTHTRARAHLTWLGVSSHSRTPTRTLTVRRCEPFAEDPPFLNKMHKIKCALNKQDSYLEWH